MGENRNDAVAMFEELGALLGPGAPGASCARILQSAGRPISQPIGVPVRMLWLGGGLRGGLLSMILQESPSRCAGLCKSVMSTSMRTIT